MVQGGIKVAKVTLKRRKSSPTARGGSWYEEKTLKCSKRVEKKLDKK